MDPERWAQLSVVKYRDYWEACFPGHGTEIVRLTAQFYRWRPVFATADPGLEQDILEGSRWMGAQGVRVSPLSRADEAQGTVDLVIAAAFSREVRARVRGTAGQRLFHEANDAVGDAFGSVAGPPVPDVMLRAWLYDLLVAAIVCVVADELELAVQIEKVLRRWKQGHYLIGFDTKQQHPVAVVIVADDANP